MPVRFRPLQFTCNFKKVETMISQAKKPITSLDDLRRELRYRFQDELVNTVQGPSDTLVEMVCDPMETERYPLFASVSKEASTATRRGPSRSGGAAEPTAKNHFPPLTSRGVTKRNSSEKLPCPTPKKVLGGYDGGAEVGFNGEWNPKSFKSLLSLLETARLAAENEGSDDRFVTLHGMTFSVQAHGGNAGAHYKYIMTGQGMKVYIHANPKGPVQPIRIRYGFESLCGRDLFAVHANTLEWFQKLGFKVVKETVTRVDMQVMLLRKISDIASLIMEDKVICKALDYVFHGKKGKSITSFTAGKRIQVCIYNKRHELLTTGDEVKLNMMIEDCLCGELPDELTRVEFRMRRAALKYFGVNTIQDLLDRERSIVEFLTFDWFRLLAKEKSKGNEKRQAMHPIWHEVRELFFEYFPGPVEGRKPIDRNNSRRELKCTGESLIKQAVGCLATAAAVVKGVFEDEKAALTFVYDLLSEKIEKFTSRTFERVKELGIIRGVEAPNAIDWHLDPRYACGSSDSVTREYHSSMFDEEYQYQKFREYAVEGCPF